MAVHSLFNMPGSGASRDISSRMYRSPTNWLCLLSLKCRRNPDHLGPRLMFDMWLPIPSSLSPSRFQPRTGLAIGSNMIVQFFATNSHFLYCDSEENSSRELRPPFL